MYLCMCSSHLHTCVHTVMCAHYCLKTFFQLIVECLVFWGYLYNGILYNNENSIHRMIKHHKNI